MTFETQSGFSIRANLDSSCRETIFREKHQRQQNELRAQEQSEAKAPLRY
jgi:hypothetical protein